MDIIAALSFRCTWLSCSWVGRTDTVLPAKAVGAKTTCALIQRHPHLTSVSTDQVRCVLCSSLVAPLAFTMLTFVVVFPLQILPAMRKNLSDDFEVSCLKHSSSYSFLGHACTDALSLLRLARCHAAQVVKMHSTSCMHSPHSLCLSRRSGREANLCLQRE